LQSDEEGRERTRPSVAALISDGILAIIAGSDTTATVLSAMFYHLLGNPESLARVEKEINEYFGQSEPVDTEKLKNMPYLNACM
jgi:cytochrome P450